VSDLAYFVHRVFYPTHYALASYPNLEDAEKATQDLVSSGLERENVIAVPGDDVVLVCRRPSCSTYSRPRLLMCNR
jgi:hypothetical protein